MRLEGSLWYSRAPAPPTLWQEATRRDLVSMSGGGRGRNGVAFSPHPWFLVRALAFSIGQDPQPPVQQVLGPAGTWGHLFTALPSLAALVPLASSPEVCSGATSPWLPVSLPRIAPCLTASGSCLRPLGPPSCESGRWLERELAAEQLRVGGYYSNIHHHLITIR